MIVDDSFNDLARLNTNYHALSSTILPFERILRLPSYINFINGLAEDKDEERTKK